MSTALIRSESLNCKELFRSIHSSSVRLTPQAKEQYEPILWHSVCTEYDARNLYSYFNSSSCQPTLEFREFLQLWGRDESNHTEGFAILYSILYGMPEKDIYTKLQARPVNFRPLKEFFSDEFKLCLLLAYDEIVTTWVYHRSVPFYKSLGPKELTTWILRLKADEARHFSNLIQVLKAHHRHRFTEAQQVLDSILQLEGTLNEYGATFVLDHGCADFSLSQQELVSLCRNVILRKLGIQPKGPQCV